MVNSTYDQVNLLVEALHTLRHQTLVASEYEVVIVNNNSTDDIREVVDQIH